MKMKHSQNSCVYSNMTAIIIMQDSNPIANEGLKQLSVDVSVKKDDSADQEFCCKAPYCIII